MRTRPFRTVLEQVLALSGTPYSAASAEQLEIAANAISLRVNEGYERYPFPELLLFEERAFADDYDATVTYDPGDVVWYSTTSLYYECDVTSTGNAPTNASYWTATDLPAAKLINREQRGENKIGRLWGVWRDDPRITTYNASIDVVQTADGWVAPKNTANTVWIIFSKPPPIFTSIAYDAGGSYARYDQVFSPGTENATLFPDRGENYQLELDDAGDPFWLLISFPACLQGFVGYGAAADIRLYQGNRDPNEVGQMQAKADTLLADEWDKVKPIVTALITIGA